MRLIAAIFLISLGLLTGSVAQQTTSQQSGTPDAAAQQTQTAKSKHKKNKSEQPATSKTEEENPPQSTEPGPAPKTEAEQQKSEFSKHAAGEKAEDNEEHFDLTEVAPVVTHHQISVDGKLLKYTATTGRLPIKRGDGKIEAEVFFIAYTLDGESAANRPLTFAFNGGPGSASIWLHMGALGPQRVVMDQNGFLPPAPYHLMDNPYTLLDKSDLVLVDAIGTGFSRAGSIKESKKFWSVKGDIEAFGEFIRLYLARYERWGSPLFLFGESYGTTRAAGVAGYLAGQGISFNGITLLSTALSFQTLEDNRSNDQPYIFLIPTFTMIAGYHHKLPPDLSGDLTKARQEAEQFATGEYATALAKGDALGSEERQKVIDDLARYTGLSKEIIDQANLRIDVPKFTHYLLIDQKLRVGRLDGRFTGPDPGGLLDTPFYDPTESEILPPFTSMFNDYVRGELGYKTDMPYYSFAPHSDADDWWNWGSGIHGFPDTATALREALVKDQYLKVLVMEGYYDLATPYLAANYTMSHLDLGTKYLQNISFATYDSGHMVYLSMDSLKKLKSDQANFMQQAGGRSK